MKILRRTKRDERVAHPSRTQTCAMKMCPQVKITYTFISKNYLNSTCYYYLFQSKPHLPLLVKDVFFRVFFRIFMLKGVFFAYNELGFLQNIENWQNGVVLKKSFEFCKKKNVSFLHCKFAIFDVSERYVNSWYVKTCAEYTLKIPNRFRILYMYLIIFQGTSRYSIRFLIIFQGTSKYCNAL